MVALWRGAGRLSAGSPGCKLLLSRAGKRSDTNAAQFSLCRVSGGSGRHIYGTACRRSCVPRADLFCVPANNRRAGRVRYRHAPLFYRSRAAVLSQLLNDLPALPFECGVDVDQSMDRKSTALHHLTHSVQRPAVDHFDRRAIFKISRQQGRVGFFPFFKVKLVQCPPVIK